MTTTSLAGRLRTAGIATLIAGLGFLPQPLLIFVLPAPDGSEFWPAGRLGDLYVRATIQAITWGVFSSALIVAVVAIASIASNGLWARVGSVFGIIAGAAWLLESAARLAPRAGGVVDHLADSGVSEQTQGAILYLLDVIDLGWTAFGAIAIGVWLLMLATSPETPLRSRTVRVIAGVVGAVQLPAAYLFPLPAAAAGVFATLIVIGIALLVQSRRGPVRVQAPGDPAAVEASVRAAAQAPGESAAETDAAPAANPSA